MNNEQKEQANRRNVEVIAPASPPSNIPSVRLFLLFIIHFPAQEGTESDKTEVVDGDVHRPAR